MNLINIKLQREIKIKSKEKIVISVISIVVTLAIIAESYNTEDWLIIVTSDHGGPSIQERMTFVVMNKE